MFLLRYSYVLKNSVYPIKYKLVTFEKEGDTYVKRYEDKYSPEAYYGKVIEYLFFYNNRNYPTLTIIDKEEEQILRLMTTYSYKWGFFKKLFNRLSKITKEEAFKEIRRRFLIEAIKEGQ